jgi:AraC-like DNA-binding protein
MRTTASTKRNFIKSYKAKLIICFLIPAAITLTLYSIVNAILLNNVKKQLLSQCRQAHTGFALNYELEFQDLYQNSLILLNNASFKNLYFSSAPLSAADYYMLHDALLTLNAFTASKSFILQTGFVNPVNERYISSSCTSYLNDYYGNPSFGTILNRKGAYNVRTRRKSIFQIYPLDHIDHQTIIPIVQYQCGSYILSDPLIYYLKKSSFTADLSKYLMTENSSMFVYSTLTNQVIASTLQSQDADVRQLLTDTTPPVNGISAIRIDGRPYYCIQSSSQTGYCDPLLFISLIPFSDIRSQTNMAWRISLFALIVCCISSALISFFLAVKLYAPVNRIMRFFPHQGSSSHKPVDEMNLLDKHIESLVVSNSNMQNIMSNALPLVYTQYITNILCQRTADNRELESIIRNYNFHFPYPYFSCSIIRPRLMPAFYKDFSSADQTVIISKLNDVLSLTTNKECVKYVFYKEDDCFCVITNAPAASHDQLLENDFAVLQKLFSFDSNYVQIYIGCGLTVESLEQLHRSYQQAQTAISRMSAFNAANISFYSKQNCNQDMYLLASDNDSHLSTYLLQGNQTAADLLLTEIITANQNARISDTALQDLYVHLYELGNQVLRCRKTDIQILMSDEYVSISSFIHNMNNLERSDYIRKYYQALCGSAVTDSTSTSFDLEQIRSYVDTHYQTDLCLEELAERYHTSPKYMSRVLKQALGSSFKQYITALRITRAKELLIGATMKIDEISHEIGFNSRNSFIRIFKQTVGTTPSEFRTLNRT